MDGAGWAGCSGSENIFAALSRFACLMVRFLKFPVVKLKPELPLFSLGLGGSGTSRLDSGASSSPSRSWAFYKFSFLIFSGLLRPVVKKNPVLPLAAPVCLPLTSWTLGFSGKTNPLSSSASKFSRNFSAFYKFSLFTANGFELPVVNPNPGPEFLSSNMGLLVL